MTHNQGMWSVLLTNLIPSPFQRGNKALLPGVLRLPGLQV